MPTDVIAGALGDHRIAGASKGVSLSTTAAFVGLIKGTSYVELIPRNFVTAVVLRFARCPYLAVLKTDTALGKIPTDYSDVAQDGSTATSVDLSNLPALANSGALWIGSHVRFRGAHIDVDGPNGTAGTLTVHYPNPTLTLTDISATDNTDTGASLAVDGTVTWSIPASGGWTKATLREICVANSIAINVAKFAHSDEPMYWTRWTWDAAMDAAVTLDHMLGLNESTSYAESPDSVGLGMRVHHGFGRNGVGGFELLVDAGTGNCLVNCFTVSDEFAEGAVP